MYLTQHINHSTSLIKALASTASMIIGKYQPFYSNLQPNKDLIRDLIMFCAVFRVENPSVKKHYIVVVCRACAIIQRLVMDLVHVMGTPACAHLRFYHADQLRPTRS